MYKRIFLYFLYPRIISTAYLLPILLTYTNILTLIYLNLLMISNITEAPIVSVGLTTRNRATLLSNALDALLDQTFRNIEIIVSDNGSSDNTPDVVRYYMERDPRIFYFRQNGLIGGLDNLAFTVKKARGRYFMWACDDDWWDPRFIEVLVAVLEKCPEYNVAMSYFNEKRVGEGIEEILVRTHDYTNMSNLELYRMYMRGKVRPIFLFGLYRTNIRKKVDIPHCFNGIYLFLAEIVLSGKAYSVQEVLFTWRNDLRPTQVRHTEHPYAKAQKTAFAITLYLLLALFIIFGSSIVPWHRKLFVFGPWFGRLWYYKRKLFKEWFGFIK